MSSSPREERRYLQAAPLALILGFFLLLPMVALIVVSFFDYDSVQIIPGFVLTNYQDVLGSSVTWRTYLNTLRFTAIVWAVTLVVGFWVSFYLAFDVRSRVTQLVLFLVCTIPFLTSNIIRMISWVPFLGREGLLNTALLRLGLIRAPLEFLLFSDFAVVLAYVHLYTLFMVTPIFNTMMRIDRRFIEAAIDGGARPWQVIAHVIVPLCKPGIAIGSIFVVTLVMGDFITVRLMSGGQSASVGLDDRQPDIAAAVPRGLRQCRGAAGRGVADDRGNPAHRRHQERAMTDHHSPPPLVGGGWGEGATPR